MTTQAIPLDIQALLVQVCKVAQVLDIPDISIEDNNKGKMVRGFNTSHGSPILISHFITDIDLPFQSLAINDCRILMARYDFARSQDKDFDSFMNIDENSKKVTSIQFKKSKAATCSKFSIDFSAGNADTVRSPKGVKDDVVFSFTIDPSHATTLQRSSKAIVGENLTLVYDGSELSYEIKSTTKDVFRSVFGEIEGQSKPFAYSYPIKLFLPCLQYNESHEFNITTRGLLNCKVHGINVYILPKV